MTRPLCALLVVLASAAAAGVYRIDLVAGSSLNGDGGPAILAQLGALQGVAVDGAGNVYFSDTDHHRVRRVDAAGIISTVAGTGAAGFGGDGGAAISAQLNLPYGLAVDAAGNLYVADLGNERIRRISADGVIRTYAGGGVTDTGSDGGPALNAVLRTPRNVALDAAGNLYIAEFDGHRIRKVTPDGRIATVAGTGLVGFSGDGGPAFSAQLAYPAGILLDRAGNLYIADSQNLRIRKISTSGNIATAASGLATPTAVAVDAAGTIYVSDSSGNLRSCTAAAVACATAAPFAGDLALDVAGTLYVAGASFVHAIDAHGAIRVVAGDGYRHTGDGGPATSAQLLQPAAVAVDSADSMFIADSGTQSVRQVLPDGTIQTVAAGVLNAPSGVAVDAKGNVLVADSGNHRVRSVSPAGAFTITGTGAAGNGPEGLTPENTALNAPGGVCVDGTGAIFVVDTGNHRVLRFTIGGVVRTAAGNGSPGDAGDGGPARTAQLNRPAACALDAAGNLFIADTGNHRIRKVTSDGAIATIAGTGQPGTTQGMLRAPRGVAVDSRGNVFISDSGNNRILELTADGVLRTITQAGDVQNPGGLALDAAGNLYAADTGNNRVVRLSATAAVVQVVNAGSLAAGAVSPGEIVSILAAGGGIGPDAGIAAALDSTGALPTQLGGVEVRFDGIAAPLLYAQARQINVQTPYTVAGASTHAEIFLDGEPVSSTDLAVAPSAPGLFPSPNSIDNPAARGSVMIFYATGEGLMNGSTPMLPVVLTVDGVAAQLLYAGRAPGTVGILQLNAVIPGGFLPAGAAVVRLAAGDAVSPPLTIWLK